MLRERVAPQSEVIRAILLEDSPCLWGRAPAPAPAPAPAITAGALIHEKTHSEQLSSAHKRGASNA